MIMTESNYITGDMTAGVLANLRTKTGLYLPDKPIGDIPALPTDITVLADEDLMILYTDFTVWADYAASQLSVAAAEEREYGRLHDLKKAREMAVTSSAKGSVTAARAAAEEGAAGDGYRASERYSYRKILESISGNLERDAALLSRELSRRLGDKAPTRNRRMWGTP
jgi:hypothetical protein